MVTSTDWVLLAYRVPRIPSTPRIAIWRKLKNLGVAQLGDGLVALPSDARTKEQLEWIADDVVAAGGTALLWIARSATRAQERQIASTMAAEVEAEYDTVVAHAHDARFEPPGSRKRTETRLRREVRRIRQRDYFPQGGYERAFGALDDLRVTVEEPVR